MSTDASGSASATPDAMQPSPSSPDPAPPSHRPAAKKPQRVLACVLCQQRKVRCDRSFPCANCLKFKVPCIPATVLPRKRKRRFPERELLDRIRKHEAILRQHGLKFEPLHGGPSADKTSPSHHDGDAGSDEEHTPDAAIHDEPSPSTTIRSEKVPEVKSIWSAMSLNRDCQDHEYDSDSDRAISEKVVKSAMHGTFASNDYFLFGQSQTLLDLSAVHPQPVQIFRLWQVYLDNVNALLRVTHSPTMQPVIIEAAGDLSAIDPNLEALMFGIYCMAIRSLMPEACAAMFAEPKDTLLTRYQFGCQQALLKADYARTSDRNCLTAQFLYLVSFHSKVDPRSLHPMLGVAVRIAYRQGIHSEASLAKRSVFEAEMCRRLWWAILLFDARVGEAADYKSSILSPIWDCRVPLNVNESDLRPEMRELPAATPGKCSDAIFAVVRAELGDFLRHAAFHLDFTHPILNKIAKELRDPSVPEGQEIAAFERLVEDKYLRFADEANPLHYMAIWNARNTFAKYRLVERYSEVLDQEDPPTVEQRDALNALATHWLEVDTRMVDLGLTAGYVWFAESYFPFPAFMQILSDLKRRPMQQSAGRSWEAIDENFMARWVRVSELQASPIIVMFANMVLQAWVPREAVLGPDAVPPEVVTYLRDRIEQWSAAAAAAQGAPSSSSSASLRGQGPARAGAPDVLDTAMKMDGASEMPPMPVLPDFRDTNTLYDMAAMGQASFAGMQGLGQQQQQTGMDVDLGQLNWGAFDWTPEGAAVTGAAAPGAAFVPSGLAETAEDQAGWMFK